MIPSRLFRFYRAEIELTSEVNDVNFAETPVSSLIGGSNFPSFRTIVLSFLNQLQCFPSISELTIVHSWHHYFLLSNFLSYSFDHLITQLVWLQIFIREPLPFPWKLWVLYEWLIFPKSWWSYVFIEAIVFTNLCHLFV